MELFNSLLISMPLADMASGFSDSTLPGKMIVIVLFLGSAAAWTIMLTKRMQLSFASRSSRHFLSAFRTGANPTTLYVQEEEFPGSPLHTIYKEGCHALETELQAHGIYPEQLGELDSAYGRVLTLNQLEALRTVVDRNVADEALNLEDQMGLLATAVSAAPFLGLLGTVWGVMDAFSGMAASGSAALSAVAPGISGALLTTIVGLLVALPSMIGYNLLSAHIRRISVQMDNFAQEFISGIQNTYVREG
ncbi:MotA/TolQ/ExbB proton channel family protein [Pontiella sp.]|uniref:MotA/TolQ/ExbB proton channel family protein n=1 Tax=Pontiella sp. TaxID=2837462 RepID=UPI003568FDE3